MDLYTSQHLPTDEETTVVGLEVIGDVNFSVSAIDV